MIFLHSLFKPMRMKEAGPEKLDLEAALEPETELEKSFLEVPEFIEGLQWGVPRYGHPEGEIYKHVREVNENIDRLQLDREEREKLRLISFVHDTFKFKEDKSYPRDWSRHHSVYARRFLERFTDNSVLLDLAELHDEAYYAWRLIFLYDKPDKGRARLQRLLDRLGDNLQFFYLFFKCDTMTGDKNPAPLKWFEDYIPGIEVVTLSPARI